MSDRVKPNRQYPPALKIALFAVSERTALAKTLFGTELKAPWALNSVAAVGRAIVHGPKDGGRACRIGISGPARVTNRRPGLVRR